MVADTVSITPIIVPSDWPTKSPAENLDVASESTVIAVWFLAYPLALFTKIPVSQFVCPPKEVCPETSLLVLWSTSSACLVVIPYWSPNNSFLVEYPAHIAPSIIDVVCP